jgi:hypothetical protein
LTARGGRLIASLYIAGGLTASFGAAQAWETCRARTQEEPPGRLTRRCGGRTYKRVGVPIVETREPDSHKKIEAS